MHCGGIPEDLRRILAARLHALPPVERVRLRRTLPSWTRLAPIRIAAIALPSTIYGMEMPAESDMEGWERLAHELCHVEQWARLGRFGFLRRYCGAYLKNRVLGMTGAEAYREIPLEREARAVAAEVRVELERTRSED